MIAYSYPLFNRKHNLVFITYEKYAPRLGEGTPFTVYTYQKDSLGIWKLLYNDGGIP